MPATPVTPGTPVTSGVSAQRATGAASGRFVVQEHHARALHWDFRLEHQGVLVSWALPKGVPLDPGIDHLAVPTEDHPLTYYDFAGQIPRGEYGTGTVTIFDRGTYNGVWQDDEVKVVLHGAHLSGGWALFRTGDDKWMIHRERQPLPDHVVPMLATAAPPPADDGTWAFEMKWDGVRAIAYIGGGRLRLLSRNDRDITQTYPDLAGLVGALGRSQVVLDGEVVAFDAAGRPSFEALQQRMNISSPGRAQAAAGHVPVCYMVFDLLHLNGRPLLGLPYRERRVLLEELGLSGPRWQIPPVFTDATAADALRTALLLGLEGVVAKRLEAPYQSGRRSRDWRKIKNVRRQEAVVGGWKPGEGGRTSQLGSLLLGVYDASGRLRFCGHVGTGFTQQTLLLVAERLAPLRSQVSPFAGQVPREHARDAVWVEPELVVEVAFAEWTSSGLMRHPSYKGLRTDKDPAEVIREP